MIIPVNNAVIAAPQLRSSLRGRSRPYAMKVTIFFLAQSFLASSLVALLVGRFCGNLLLEKVSNSLVKDRHDQRLQKSLPRIFFRRDKQVPSSIYTSKTFDNGFLTSLDSFLAHPESSGPIVAHENLDRGKTNVGLMEVDGLTVDTIHDPSGQHLLIDIKNVDIEFLNSEERLVSAMIDIVALSDLTLLSYHCHTWKPVGVSCIGVLLESHISLHTWPLQGVIILDLFTCGNKSLLPFLPIIEERFAIPKRSDGEVDLPIVVWSHKKRGFRQTLKNNNLDLDHFILGWRDFDLKKMVLHVEKNSRVIDIYDVIDSRFRRFENYRKSLDKKVSSYESMNPKLFRPDRLVYSNLKMQTRRFGEVEYHESIVHSTMFSHKNPRYVAIVGGGNGAILRELLKHRSVEKVTIFEDINATEMNLSRSFLSDWSFCGDLLDGAASCFDDPRVSLGNIATFDCFEENRMHDVIFWDVSENDEDVASTFNKGWIKTIRRALASDGILSAILGRQQDSKNGVSHQSLALSNFFVENGFHAVADLSHTIRGDRGLWKTLIAFSCNQSTETWESNEAEINLEMRRRTVPTKEHHAPFHYFDGSTMMSLKYSRNESTNKATTVSTIAPTFFVEQHAPSRGLNAQRKQNVSTGLTGSSVEPISSAPRSDKIYFIGETVPRTTILPSLALIEYG